MFFASGATIKLFVPVFHAAPFANLGYLAKPIRFNTPQLAAAVERLDDELLIVTRSLSIFASEHPSFGLYGRRRYLIRSISITGYCPGMGGNIISPPKTLQTANRHPSFPE
jgi:hypothetical protein